MEPDRRQLRAHQRPVQRLPQVIALRKCVALAIVATTVVAGGRTAAQTVEAGGVINREYSIKAAFLYHFSTYVQWPGDVFTSDAEPFVIGVYHTNPFGSALDKIASQKKVAGRSIVVKSVDSPAQVKDCHMLFVPGSVPAGEWAAVLRAAHGAPVLVVGESEHFVELGGDVQFFLENNKVRFAFSAETTKGGDLKVSSKLLSLAKIIPVGNRAGSQ